MRRFLKPALVTLGAAAAAFVLVNSASFNAAPAARTKTFCQTEPATKIVQTTLVPINLPTLPTIPSVQIPEIPCIPVPTVPTLPTIPTISVPTIPPISVPTIPQITLPTIPLPDFFPTTTTTDPCQQTSAAVVAVFC